MRPDQWIYHHCLHNGCGKPITTAGHVYCPDHDQEADDELARMDTTEDNK